MKDFHDLVELIKSAIMFISNGVMPKICSTSWSFSNSSVSVCMEMPFPISTN